MASPSLIVNPSREEVWWNNFNEIKHFKEENGHLTLHDCRLSSWLTYQRYHAKTISKKKIDALESIDYMSTKAYRKCDEDNFEENLAQMLKYPSAKWNRKIQLWYAGLHRLYACGCLDPSRVDRLLKLGVNLGKEHRQKKPPGKAAEIAWNAKFEKLVQYRGKHGDCNVSRRFKEDPELANFVFNQRKRYNEIGVDGKRRLYENRIEKLESIGFEWTIRPHKGSRVIS